ncbi:MAG: hypothetical protein ACI8QC_000598 [Planctomycetota bacterium]|jgi:hypothetical protein
MSLTKTPATTGRRQPRQLVPEKIYDALTSARTADKVTMHFKNGTAVTGALIFNPFKGTGRIIDVETETSTDFALDSIRDLKFS